MCTDCAWVLRLVNASVILFAFPLLIGVAFLLNRRKERYKMGRGSAVALVFTVGFILSAFFLHYAVGCYKIHHAVTGTYVPNYVEELVDSLFRAVRIFGIPEHYTAFVADLRTMLSATVPQHLAWSQDWIVGYATVVNVIIPIAGSALILGIFARAFPKVMLFFKSLPFWREKCYFSGLNPQTVALAKSILEARSEENKWWKTRPLLIFTDAYVDKEKEQSFELLLEAKRLGAICVRDDLAHIRKAKFGARNYFLMEEDEYANLPALMGLVEDRNVPYMKKVAIYLFVGSNLYERLEKNIRERLKVPKKKTLRERWKDLEDQRFFEKVKTLWQQHKANKYKLAEDALPLLVPVNAHRNLVNNLMVDVPLYEPLVGTDKTELNVTILGNGSIGTEAFLSTYWFGQMQCCPDGKTMKPCDLHIHVVSQDDEATFWDKIDYFNPEIRRTCDESNKILDWSPNKKNPPYATVTYHTANVKMGSLGENKAWLQSDYFIVALGSDADNIAVAEKLRTCIGKRHWEATSTTNTVIAYVVYDSDLCKALNARSQVEHGVYMHAFGHLEQVYGSDNVFMTKNSVLANQTGNAYLRRSSRSHIEEQKARSSEKGNYNHWSSLARVMHIAYKIFSMGWITTSLWDDPKKHREEMLSLKQRYARVCGLSEWNLAAEDQSWRADLEDKKECLAYLEHRRWNAFIRSMGYRRSEKRNFSLKLHPCLVETRGPQEADYYYTKKDAVEVLDGLDALRTADCDYKAYDYPYDDVGDLIPLHWFMAWNDNEDGTLKVPHLDATELRRRCKKSTSAGVYRDRCLYGEDWIIPGVCLHQWMGDDLDDLYEQMKKEMHRDVSTQPQNCG